MISRIEINPRICSGKPVIHGTRIPVTVVLELLAEGESWRSILDGYPELTEGDLEAVLLFAKDSVEHTEVEPLLAS